MHEPQERDYLTRLHRLLVDRFDEDELRTLCFGIDGVDYDDLAGGTKGGKARELILFCKRRGRVVDLVDAGKRQRPDVPWDDLGIAPAQSAETSFIDSIATSGKKVDFVLVTTLAEERDVVLDKLPGHRRLPPSEEDIRAYFQAELPVVFPGGAQGTYQVIMMPLLGMGRVQAATATTDAIRRWHPRYILLVGIAGGIAARGANVGDILISDQVVDYELQKITPQGPEIRWDVQRADARLLNACNNFIGEGWQELVRVRRPDSSKPKCHTGPIASGDKVVAFRDVLARYSEAWPKLIGVEMEAGGVATAAFQSADPPGFFMVRCVSDLADENKGTAEVEQWRQYACDAAASFAIALLKSGPVPLAVQPTTSTAPAPRGSRPEQIPGVYKEVGVSAKQAVPDDLLSPTPMMPLPDVGDFVGRQAELEYFSKRLAAQHAAVITGMAGVGKTALASVLARRLNEEDVFWHTFHAGEGVETLVWELAGFLARHGQADMWRLLQGARRVASPPPPVEVIFNYLIPNLSRHSFLICLDDFQHVDEDPKTLQFVRQLYERAPRSAVSLILTSRRLPKFVKSAEYKMLVGLGAADVRELLANSGLPLPGNLVSQLHHSTEGNAQFVTLAVDLLKTSRSPQDVIARIAEQEDIEQYLLTEIDSGLNEGEREVMGAVAALLGYPGPLEVIEILLDRGNVLQELNRLRSRNLLTMTESATGREYGQHSIVQAYYYRSLGPGQLEWMHRRAGEYYAAGERDSIKAARHFLQIDDFVRAARIMTGDVWRLVNEGQASVLLDLFRRLPEERLEPDLAAQANLAQGQICAVVGESEAAVVSFQKALALVDRLADPVVAREVQSRACRGMGEALQYESLNEAIAWLQRGLAAMGDGNQTEAAALHIDIGRIQIGQGEYAAALRELERGLELLPAGPSHWRASALGNIGLIYCAQGDDERGRDYYCQAMAICEELHDSWRIIGLRHNLGIEIELAGDWEGADAQYAEGLRLAERLGSISYQAELALSLGVLTTKRGGYEAAATHLMRCIELARSHDLNMQLIHALCSLADVRIRRGQAEAAMALLAEAEQLAQQAGAKEQQPEILRGRAQVSLVQNQAHEALEAATESVNLARELGLQIDVGMGLRVVGQALAANGQRAESLDAYSQSEASLADQDPYEAARTKADWGLTLVAGGDVEKGEELLSDARATFERLGALGDLESLAAKYGASEANEVAAAATSAT